MEEEYMALMDTACKAIWWHQVLEGFGYSQANAVLEIKYKNKGAGELMGYN
ncbi:hypothetical protein CROQUDRAFT_101020 [Cronartium quercuum f. sp. fusiforme G11]|uniref:Uncharacterized protein n=1 Tax=Cronartium quercuum f. sp. fusiforme G11 TaxID=708437 RepID=A0A9P6N9B7_9BASI|nr:hypothetical protein CROQUDRAFT_101020 [Cronartium quercuum f. sp. fusiforme G11]